MSALQWLNLNIPMGVTWIKFWWLKSVPWDTHGKGETHRSFLYFKSIARWPQHTLYWDCWTFHVEPVLKFSTSYQKYPGPQLRSILEFASFNYTLGAYCLYLYYLSVADPGGVRGVQMHPPFEGLPSRILSKFAQTWLRTLRPTLTIVEYHNK